MVAKRFLRVDEACERLGCSANTIRNMIRDGRLAAHRPAKRLLIPVESVEKLLEKSRIKNE